MVIDYGGLANRGNHNVAGALTGTSLRGCLNSRAQTKTCLALISNCIGMIQAHEKRSYDKAEARHLGNTMLLGK